MSLLVAVPGVRARAYLQTLVATGLAPQEVLVLGKAAEDPAACPGSQDRTPDPDLRLYEPVRDTLRRHDLPFRELPAADLHDPAVVAAVARSRCRFAIFTGGGILRTALLSAGPRWIHVHPGRLPDHRGSTCIYYSMLLERRLSASAFFMEPGLDVGNVIARRTVEIPAAPPTAFDHGIDVWLRAQVLVDALQRLADPSGPPAEAQDRTRGQLFYVVHPVLKHLALRASVPEEAVVHSV